MRHLLSLCVVAASVCACGTKPSQELLTQTGLEPRKVRVTAGVAFEYDVQFRNAAGVLTEPGYLDVLGTPRVDLNNPSTPTATYEDTLVEPGHHRYRVTPIELKTIRLGVEWRTCSTNACPLTQAQGLELQVEPRVEFLHPLAGSTISLGVGEKRQASLLPWGTTRGDLENSRIAWAWGAPVMLSSSDPRIARIVDGRIEGVAPGSATVTATSGEASVTLNVTVTATALGPPREGLHPVFDRVDTNEGGARHLQPPLFQQLHVDSRGYPVTLGVHFGNLAGQSMRWLPASVAQWTGTGFEQVRVGRPGDAVVGPRLVLDSTDRRYVLYRSRNGMVSSSIVVADFDADATDERVRYRDLPVRAEPPEYEEQRDVTTFAYGMTARTGGGVWVAWVVTEGDLNSGPVVCDVRVRLAEVTADAVRVQEVAVAKTIPKNTCTSKSVYRVGEDENSTVFLSQGSGAAPDIFLSGLAEFRPEHRDVRFSLGADGAWTMSDVEPTKHWPGGPVSTIPDDDWPDGIVGDPEPFRIEAGGEVWLGNEHPGVLKRGPFVDDPSPRWFPGTNLNTGSFSTDRRNWLTQGVAGTPTRLHQTVGQGLALAYGVVDLPVRATTTGAETSGRLLTTAQQPWMPTELSVTSDGARFVALRRQNASLITQRIGEAYNPWVPTFLDERQVVRASAPEQPFAPVTLPANVTLLGPIVREGSTTMAIGSGPAGLLLLTSTDAGLTFATTRTQAVGGTPTGVVHVGGAFLVVCKPVSGNIEVWRVGVTTADSTTRSLTAPNLRADGKLVASNTTAAWLERVAPNTMRLLRWDVDGTLVENVQLTGDVNFDTVFAEGPNLWAATAGTVFRRGAGANSFSPAVTLEGRVEFRTAFARIRSGLLANVVMKRVKPDCFQAALITSTDEGATWSTPTLLRPTGGCLQLPWQVEATEDGTGVALALSDNQSLRAWEYADGVLQSPRLGLFPAHDTLFLRAPAP